MKIKVKEKSYQEVLKLKPKKHSKPKKQLFLIRLLLKTVSLPALWKTRFTYKKIGMDRLGKKEPALILMNHSSFIDLKIASSVLFSRRFNIVCTSDGFIGKNILMKLLGCIPTEKFVPDVTLVKDMVYAVKKLKSSVLMYPEASYSFDGTATVLPESLGKFIKLLGVPVVMITTEGAFSHDPLYNNLRLRKVKVSAEIRYVLSSDDIKEKSVDEINEIVGGYFEFDNFRWQQENKVKIDEPFRADDLNRVLYKCPHCLSEGKMQGKGTEIRCNNCGETYRLTEYGFLENSNGIFDHIPDWYTWQRGEVRKEIENGEYRLDIPVDICMQIDNKCIYRVGEGNLVHDSEGFTLKGCGGELEYTKKAASLYSLYSDFNWYEIGDVICIGDKKTLYYCFPKVKGDFVAKTRLATEEIYKLSKLKEKVH